jgi:hypothetical protein
MRTVKPGTNNKYDIWLDEEVVGTIKKTEDKTGHKCWGVFFNELPPKFCGSFASAVAVAKYYDDCDLA